jgi:hypothetical protein
MNLIQMEPRGDLSSTGYALANPGKEYLILQPNETSDPFTAKLEPGTYLVEWFSVNSRETKSVAQAIIDSVGDPSFMAPFEETGPAVLYLKRVAATA